jgi:hypothetical protein
MPLTLTLALTHDEDEKFLALPYVCPISCGFFLVSAIPIPSGTQLK